MKDMAPFRILDGKAVLVNPLDNVATAMRGLKNGSVVHVGDIAIRIRGNVRGGERFALNDIQRGDYLFQYGHPFAQSSGIRMGERISQSNTADKIPRHKADGKAKLPPVPYPGEFEHKTFMGYRRPGGSAGTRNYYLIVPTSMCASETAVQIANKLEGFLKKRAPGIDGPGIDGIVALPHTEGCGCAAGLQIERLLTVLKNTIRHPNVGGALIVDLGCEQTNYGVVHKFFKDGPKHIPLDWLTIQKEGGIRQTIEKAVKIVQSRLPAVGDIGRSPCPLGGLILGAECGASDSFSGITANPLIGDVADKVVSGKGSAIFSETPEMVGAEDILMRRMRDGRVIEKFKGAMKWYRDIAKRFGTDMSYNLVPENKAGGLMNVYIKSLGAIAKGGTARIEDFLEYGERLKRRGLNIMQGPGNDLESVTGLAASGANVICFSTGRGTVTGSAIVPVIKISSRSELYHKMSGDMDFDAGRLFGDGKVVSFERLSDELFGLLLDVASGRKTKSEKAGQRQFQVWTAGKISL